MYIGTSIFLIAVGAILKFAVTATVAGVDIQTAGVILMVVGVIALVISLMEQMIWADRRRAARSSPRWRRRASTADPSGPAVILRRCAGGSPHASWRDSRSALSTPGVAGAVQPAPCEPVGEYPGDAASKPGIARWMAGGAAAGGLPAELPVIAALVDSGLTNLQAEDSDAVGYFQMRLPIWNTGEYEGYPEDPDLQLKWFTDQAAAVRQTRLAAGRAGPAVRRRPVGRMDRRRGAARGGLPGSLPAAPRRRTRADRRAVHAARGRPERRLAGPGGTGPERVRAPRLALRLTQGQRPLRRRAILLRAGCPGEACVIAASGSLRIPGSKRVYRLASKPHRLARGRSATLTLKLSKPSGAR